MPTSGARSGTKPSRSERGAGDGRSEKRISLICGHGTAGEPLAITLGKRYFVCPTGCGLQREKRR